MGTDRQKAASSSDPATQPSAKAPWTPEPVDLRLAIAPQVHERLRRAITTLAILPSEALSEKDLALQLAVSRTPVREALIRLADEGLIDILPQRGSFVAPIRLRDVEEAQFIREALEVAVVRRLAGHASASFLRAANAALKDQAKAARDGDRERFLELDEGFHRSLCEEAGLPRSWRVIQTVKLQMDRVRYLSLPEAGHLQHLLAQHFEILETLTSGQPDKAAANMSGHLQEVLRTVRKLSSERPELFA